jgi:SAM-dependent methyltransferase
MGPMRTLTAQEYYAEIAEFYDEETKSPIMLAEDIVLFDFLENEGLLQGAVLDAGCGTGLLLDHCYRPNWEITEYRGYDFSKEMLDKMKSKWPSFRERLNRMSFLDDHDKIGGTFDAVLSLYAGLNCLTRSEMSLAFHNLWKKVKKGGTMCLMTYGNVAPEDRETSLHNIVTDKKGYAYTMIEESVLYTWLRDLSNSTDVRILPFSLAQEKDESEPMTSSDNMESILYHRNRIENDLDEATLRDSMKGGTRSPSCSFFLCLATKTTT